VLGWGGYWGWDPVENVALLPWLLATAFVHSIIVQERRGMLKVWNMSLIVGAYILAVFATFTVRSGLIQSVHTFATSSIGTYFLSYLAIVIVVSIGLLAYRVRGLRAERAIESVVSRESGFLLNNLLFTAMAFAIFWGTIFPLFSQLFGSTKLTVGPPFYNEVAGPIMLALLILMGVGPLLAWRHSSWRPLLRSMRWSLLAAAIAIPVFTVLVHKPLAVLGFSAVVFTVSTIIAEYARGARVRHRTVGESYLTAIPSLLRKNNRRYGGYVVHLAMAVLAVGIIGTQFFQTERQFTMKPGDTSTISGYTITYNGLVDTTTKEGDVVSAMIDVSQHGKLETQIQSKRFFYTGFESQPTARMGIKTVGVNDIYVVLDRWEANQTASIRIYINPLANWIWWGGYIFVIGLFTLLWPAARPERQRVPRTVKKAALSEA
jgi:cytochrome c-type biogenesis protein CcmF